MRVAIVGAGGVGGLLGGLLARAGAEVTVLARGAHADAIREHGLRVDSPLGRFTAPVVAVARGPGGARPGRRRPRRREGLAGGGARAVARAARRGGRRRRPPPERRRGGRPARGARSGRSGWRAGSSPSSPGSRDPGR